MTNQESFTELTHTDLESIAGGVNPVVKKTAKFVAKKLGPVGAAWTAYDGVKGVIDARDQGKGWGESLWEGAKAAVW